MNCHKRTCAYCGDLWAGDARVLLLESSWVGSQLVDRRNTVAESAALATEGKSAERLARMLELDHSGSADLIRSG